MPVSRDRIAGASVQLIEVTRLYCYTKQWDLSNGINFLTTFTQGGGGGGVLTFALGVTDS